MAMMIGMTRTTSKHIGILRFRACDVFLADYLFSPVNHFAAIQNHNPVRNPLELRRAAITVNFYSF